MRSETTKMQIPPVKQNWILCCSFPAKSSILAAIPLLLPDAEKTLARRNLVTEGATNLGRGKRHAVVVELEQSLEVEELTLSSLGTQETRELAGGSNARGEHEVEDNGFRDIVASLGRFDLVGAHQFAEFRARVVVNLLYCRMPFPFCMTEAIEGRKKEKVPGCVVVQVVGGGDFESDVEGYINVK